MISSFPWFAHARNRALPQDPLLFFLAIGSWPLGTPLWKWILKNKRAGYKIDNDLKSRKLILNNKDTLLENEKSLLDPMLLKLLELGAEPLSPLSTVWHRYNKTNIWINAFKHLNTFGQDNYISITVPWKLTNIYHLDYLWSPPPSGHLWGLLGTFSSWP